MSLDGMEAVSVKQECDSDGCGDNEAALYEDHVVKQELVLGPELLQPRDIVYTLRASLKTEDKDTHEQTLLNGSCSVVLERLFLDPELRTYTIGQQTYSDRLCDQNQERQTQTEVTPTENKSSQAHVLAVKKTESSKTNKRTAPVEEKRENPSKKIAKNNSAEKNQEPSAASQDSPSSTDIQGKREKLRKNISKMNHPKMVQEPSAATQDDLPPKTNVEEVSPEKPVVSNSSINTHMLMRASSHKVSKVFTCKTCNCTFDIKLLLHEHEKSRHGVKYFACDECEYATKYARDLQYHLRTHTGEKPYKCRQCSSAFTTSSQLKCHLRTHTGEKPFKCMQCSSAFTTSGQLKCHLRTHTSEKPYKCSQCSSAFTQSTHLQKHYRTHTGEKPFECNICDYKTTASSYLKDHLMSRHSGQKPFGCDACSYRAATKSYIIQHMKARHKSV